MMQLQMSLPSSPLPRPHAPLSSPVGAPLQRARRLTISAAAGPTASTSGAVAASMYELLSVPETAGLQEIKAAYRRQARQWHPDTCPATSNKELYAQQFMRARQAYEVLSDPVLREDYDLALRTGIGASGWAAAAFREGAERSGGRRRRGGGDWWSQLEGLKRRSASRPTAGPETWGSRMRSAGDRPVDGASAS